MARGSVAAPSFGIQPAKTPGGPTIAPSKQNGPSSDEARSRPLWLRAARLGAACVAAIRDLGHRREAETALRASESRLNFVLEAMHAGGWDIDLDSGAIHRTPEHGRIFGYAPPLPEWTHERFLSHVVPEDRAGLKRDFAAVVANRSDWNYEYRIRRADGAIRWLRAAAQHQSDAGGRPRRIVGSVQDITEEMAAKRISHRLAAIVEFSDDAIIGKDLDGIVTHWNRGAEKLFGYEAGEIVGTSITRLIPADRHPEEEHILERIRRGESVAQLDTVRVARDGRQLAVSVTASPVRDDAGRVVGVSKVARDITGRKRAEAERREFERRLQEMQKLESLGILAGGIAHDFNNILTALIGNATLAGLDLPPDSPVHGNLESIKQGCLRAADLCQQMLAYSGRDRFVARPLSLNRIIEETTPLLQLSIGRTAALHFELHEPLPMINGDENQIRQVLMNLVINAAEAIGEKSGVITLRTGLTRAAAAEPGAAPAAGPPAGPSACLEVSDTGSGMDPGTLAKVFDPFFTTKFTGRGLGLSAVLGIVRRHQGAIQARSEPGRGTTFQLRFPVAGD